MCRAGRSDPEGVKALAIAAQRCFADYRPGGMRVIAGSVILEPGLQARDFAELAQKGVRLAKAGFGAVKTAYDYVPLVADAKAAGLITTCHTGGSSIPGSGAITGDHLLKMHPHVSFHINGGPTAMPDADFERVIKESEIALAGLHRRQPAHHAAVRAARRRNTMRSTASSSRPTRRPAAASCRSACSIPSRICASLTDMAPERFICAATGSNAQRLRPRQRLPRARQGRRYRADRRARRRHAATALAAIKHGDIAAIGARGDRRRASLRRPQPQHAGAPRARRASHSSRVMQDFAADRRH